MIDRFFADDRGNVVDFYDGDEQVARLNREAGNKATWDAHGEIEEWAKLNGYAEEIEQAERLQ